MRHPETLSNKQINRLIELCSKTINQHLSEYQTAIDTEQLEDEQRHIHSANELSKIIRVLQRILVNQQENI